MIRPILRAYTGRLTRTDAKAEAAWAKIADPFYYGPPSPFRNQCTLASPARERGAKQQRVRPAMD